jgi:hypothetical protein
VRAVDEVAKANGDRNALVLLLVGLKIPSLTTILRFALALALDCKVVELVSMFDKTDLRALLPK